MSITLKLDGFETLLSQIENADKVADRAAESCIRQSAQIMQSELKSQMQAAGVDNGLISRMPAFEVEGSGNRITARVGYKKGAYDPRNPSDGYEVIFINYGTPKRSKHGKIAARGFIKKAKDKARPKIKKAQKEVLEKITGRLNG